MIIKYDLKKFFEEKGLKQSFLAEKVGISKQLFNYKINQGDISLSMLAIIADEIGMPIEKLTKVLNEKYVKVKI
jgi:transcriptional regulator with XRE-family HTH domain